MPNTFPTHGRFPGYLTGSVRLFYFFNTALGFLLCPTHYLNMPEIRLILQK